MSRNNVNNHFVVDVALSYLAKANVKLSEYESGV